jgi:hypothetical protein
MDELKKKARKKMRTTVIKLNLRGNHPPKKRIQNKLDIKSILVYSPRKKAAKIIELYSIL